MVWKGETTQQGEDDWNKVFISHGGRSHDDGACLVEKLTAYMKL
jgi:hypothetical protein